MDKENFRKEVGKLLTELRPAKDVLPPSKLEVDSKRAYFAVALMVAAVFLAVITTLLPSEDRWMFGGFAFFALLVGAHQIDRAIRNR